MKAWYSFLILAIIVLSLGCTKQVAKNGDTVSVVYRASYQNGTLIDDNNGEPLEFIIGSGQVVSGFNYAVLGMKLNQEKTVTLPPEQAYGAYDESNKIIELAEVINESGVSADIGSVVYATVNKNRLRGVITDNNGTHVLIDFNSPLAGQTLVFYIKLVGITSHAKDAIN